MLISIDRLAEPEIVIILIFRFIILLIITLLLRFFLVVSAIIAVNDNLIEQSRLLILILTNNRVYLSTFLGRITIVVFISLEFAIAVVARFVFVVFRHLSIVLLLLPEGKLVLEVEVVQKGLLVHKQT